MEPDLLLMFPQQFTTRTQPEPDKSNSFKMHLSNLPRPYLDQT